LAGACRANGSNAFHVSVSFLTELCELHGDTKLMIIWDGASYHKGEEMQEYLKEIKP
jgi:hypothetical protein